jgi:hypothetical protein
MDYKEYDALERQTVQRCDTAEKLGHGALYLAGFSLMGLAANFGYNELNQLPVSGAELDTAVLSGSALILSIKTYLFTLDYQNHLLRRWKIANDEFNETE